jgi:biotin transport system substrate-specific component
VSTRLTARDLALIAVFAALIAVLGLPGSFNVPISTVPITAQTLGVMLAGSLLGARRGVLAVLTFLVLVAAGLPLLPPSPVRPQGGLAVFTSITAGFVLGWLPGAWVIGKLVELRPQRFSLGWIVLANVVGGMVVIYTFGVPVQAWVGHLQLTKALYGLIAFLPGDTAKVLISAVVTAGVLRGYPDIVPDRQAGARDRVAEAAGEPEDLAR